MKRKRTIDAPGYRLDPSVRLCPNFDYSSMALFPVADPGEMGIVVVDDFTEEHIQ